MSKYAKKDCIPKKEAFKLAKMYRNAIADINDLAYSLSQIMKFSEKYADRKEYLDAIQEAGTYFGESYVYDSDEVATIARVCYSAIDGFMSVVGNCTDLTRITKRTSVNEVAEIADEISKDEVREELILAVKDWAEKWYAQHEEEIEEL